jgi:tRNA(Ile)-lysidine synthase
VSVEARVRAGGLLRAGEPLVVMLSGGRDSVCLLDLAVRSGCDAVALHVDHRLRPDSGEDAAFCADLCAKLNVDLTVNELPPPGGGNVQAWARERRYGAAAELAGRLGAAVATGHTATDQVETVLYRLAASPGRRALLGMAAEGPVPGAGAAVAGTAGAPVARLLRPLLEVTREETAAYCAERGLPYRDDPGNESGAYARNRVRADLLPALRGLHPAAEANVLRTLALLRDEAAVLDAAVAAALTDEQAALAAMPPALARLCLQRLADDAVDPAPAVGARADELLALGGGAGTAALDLGGGLRAVAEYGRLRFERAARAAGRAGPDSTRLEVPGRATFAGGRLTCEVGAELEIADGTLDRDALAPELEIRAWRPGDRMRPLGLGGSRSLQDLFTDRKIPRERRARTPVVLSRGEIAWVPGVATGERFRVGGGTRRRARLAWLPPSLPSI